MTTLPTKKQIRHLALLRGINVGGNHTVDMRTLKNLFESLGFEHVLTYINSGNVLFSSNKTEEQILEAITRALHKQFSFEIKVLLRTEKQLQTLVKKIPEEWRNDAKQRTDILFLWDEFDKKETIHLISQNPEVDRLRYLPGAIVWNLDKAHYTKSKMHKFIGTVVYKNMTARNVNTVRKLANLIKEKG